ncbi:MAG: heavy metal translocating P-type ATPase [Clostridia bacterium]|nr:heavy metal translocating P-type ATPase [Clostridia bacterium]
MKCEILHRSRGRMRVHIKNLTLDLKTAALLTGSFESMKCVRSVSVHERTGNMIISYSCSEREMMEIIAGFSISEGDVDNAVSQAELNSLVLDRQYRDRLVCAVIGRIVTRTLCPLPVKMAITLIRSVKYILKGFRSLRNGELDVSVLDAVAITTSILRRDFATASSVMFLLGISETLEEWTHKKSVDDLARTMSLNVEKAWVVRDGTQVLMSLEEIQAGDEIVVRMGNMIPLDGKVISGEMEVNQASMTGESMPVSKGPGSLVYAGTVVEEGECHIEVEKTAGSGRYDRIVRMIEESEKLKSVSEEKAGALADKLVPYCLGGTLLTYLLTGNVTRALSLLMVDFSCALKLAMPISVLSAMRECGRMNISVKGGKFLEAVAEADTIVFDKTGTLTYAQPKVAKVVAFGGRSANEMLRIAACLEEHFPHSMANAVVEEARIRGLDHEERHSEVEYIVAHGIVSNLEGERVAIGSYHFIFEDEGVKLHPAQKAKFAEIPAYYSHLYLAIGGKLAAVICVEDPLREEAAEVIGRLHKLGITNVVMMTGDSERTAASVAKKVGVDSYYSEVLPEDKASFIKKTRQEGHKVIMVGDGINDSPALSEADAGIAISTGAAIAREIADITIASENMNALVDLRITATALMKRISRNYRFIMGFNGMLMAAGVTGLIQPTTSAVLHNSSTLAVSLRSMTDLNREPICRKACRP